MNITCGFYVWDSFYIRGKDNILDKYNFTCEQARSRNIYRPMAKSAINHPFGAPQKLTYIKIFLKYLGPFVKSVLLYKNQLHFSSFPKQKMVINGSHVKLFLKKKKIICLFFTLVIDVKHWLVGPTKYISF